MAYSITPENLRGTQRRQKGLLKMKKTSDLYEHSEFTHWLSQMPSNMTCNYREESVDLHGTRVTITFSIQDDEETE